MTSGYHKASKSFRHTLVDRRNLYSETLANMFALHKTTRGRGGCEVCKADLLNFSRATSYRSLRSLYGITFSILLSLTVNWENTVNSGCEVRLMARGGRITAAHLHVCLVRPNKPEVPSGDDVT